MHPMQRLLVIVLLSVRGTHPTKIRVLVPMKGLIEPTAELEGQLTAQMEELRAL